MLKYSPKHAKPQSHPSSRKVGLLAGIGLSTPAGTIAQHEAVHLAATFCDATEEQLRSLAALYRRTGIERRGSVLLGPDSDGPASQTFFAPARDAEDRGPTTAARMEQYAQHIGPLAQNACEAAVRDAALDPSQVTHLVTASCTGFAAPGLDVFLMKHLGLSATVERTNIGFMGCHAGINALRVAGNVTRSWKSAKVLVCAAELCSLHFAYGWDPDKVVDNAIFADGGAAAVLTPPVGDSGRGWRLWKTGSCLFPDSEEAMKWTIGDHGFEMTLSARVPELISTHLRPWLIDWLREENVAIEEIGSWAIHPGGPRIISLVAEALELSYAQTEASRYVLSQHGNMSSPTILFILERLMATDAPRPCVAIGFGPGLIAEALLLT